MFSISVSSLAVRQPFIFNYKCSCARLQYQIQYVFRILLPAFIRRVDQTNLKTKRVYCLNTVNMWSLLPKDIKIRVLVFFEIKEYPMLATVRSNLKAVIILDTVTVVLTVVRLPKIGVTV